MKSPKLPAGTIPAGATHFYFDRKRTTSVSNPWRRLDEEGHWHMLRADQWGPITGTKKHNFFAIADVLPGGRLFSEQPDEPLMASDATLRDYFALKAIQAICCDYQSKISLLKCASENGISFSEEIAGQSYSIADAMLAAREVTK